jgi:flagellar biosynthesis protein
MLPRQTGAHMASSDRDKGNQGTGKPSPGQSNTGRAGAARSSDEPADPIGPRRPRWGEPRPQAPIAIALDYKKNGRLNPQAGPRVAATGKGAVAEQILQIAFERGIPVREDPDLAQILSTLEVDSVIPVDALAAVAEILSYLYRLNGKVLDGRSAEDGDAADADSEGAPR